MAPDPDLQWLVEEALIDRVLYIRDKAEQYEVDHAHAHAQARRMLQEALGGIR